VLRQGSMHLPMLLPSGPTHSWSDRLSVCVLCPISLPSFLGCEEFRSGSRVPDRPQSLYEGWAGAACFLSDLLYEASEGASGAAKFPMFEM